MSNVDVAQEIVKNLNVNIDSAGNKLLARLEVLNRNLEIGIHTGSTVSEVKPLLVNNIQLQLFASKVVSVQHVRESFINWTLGSYFRDLIEYFHFYIEDLHTILTFVEAGEQCEEGRKISLDEFQTLPKVVNTYNTSNFPDKMNHLSKMHKIDLGLTEEMLLSLNKARNCIVHRQGILSKKDCNKENTLLTHWIGFDFKIKGDITGKEFGFGELTTEASTVLLLQEPKRKLFQIGDKINFTIEELRGIQWMIIKIAWGIRDQILKKCLQS